MFGFFFLQDVVNVVGGIGVLLPLLEQICEAEPVSNGSQETSDLLGPELTSSRGHAAMLLPLNKSAGQVVFTSDVIISFLHCMLGAVMQCLYESAGSPKLQGHCFCKVMLLLPFLNVVFQYCEHEIPFTFNVLVWWQNCFCNFAK